MVGKGFSLDAKSIVVNVFNFLNRPSLQLKCDQLSIRDVTAKRNAVAKLTGISEVSVRRILNEMNSEKETLSCETEATTPMLGDEPTSEIQDKHQSDHHYIVDPSEYGRFAFVVASMHLAFTFI